MDHDARISLGHEELIIRQRYEVFSILNDLMVALWFAAGSILFFSESTTTIGTWFFLLGSLQLMLRPAIRLTRRVHLRRVGTSGATETGQDF